jgi:hypothetical protein
LTDPERSAFVSGGVSINAASRGPGNVPEIARAAGCRPSPDARHLTLYFAASQSARLLDAVRATGAIAAVFSEPGSHRTIQLKGADARVAPIAPQDLEMIERYAGAFAAALVPLGYPEQLVRALLWAPPEDYVAVSFGPTQAFDQTPGPRAGAPLAF